MGDEHHERRREIRIPVKAEASVESDRNSMATRAKSVNMTSSGVLLRFDGPVSLAVGDRVACDFTVAHEPNVPLPYWGLGRIVRVDSGKVAVTLDSTGLSDLDPRIAAPSASAGDVS